MALKAIKSSQIITPAGMFSGALILNGDQIEDVVKDIPDNIAITDAGDKIVMPGIIDPHVHINEPGRTSWEGFDTATKAAMAGGVTTMIEMPLNASPVTTSVSAFEKKLNAATNKLHVNCGFWGGIIPGNENEIEALVEKGVFGFKAFLTHSGIDEFPNVTEDELRKAMPLIAKHKLPLLVHCELEDLHPHAQLKDPRSYQDYLKSRPKRWEDNAISMMARLCEEFNCRTHIVHLSSADSIEQISAAKEKGLPLTVETAQHYLFFNGEMITDGNTAFKCAPPIREKANNEKLWAALKEGIIDFVATDHSPAPPDIKEISSGDFSKAWGGIASIQFALPALWTVARKNGADVEDIAKWLCSGPAAFVGLSKKGKLAKGFDADLVIWDPEKNFKVEESQIQHRHKVTPYINEELFGVVDETWIAGEKIYKQRNILHLNKGEILLARNLAG